MACLDNTTQHLSVLCCFSCISSHVLDPSNLNCMPWGQGTPQCGWINVWTFLFTAACQAHPLLAGWDLMSSRKVIKHCLKWVSVWSLKCIHCLSAYLSLFLTSVLLDPKLHSHFPSIFTPLYLANFLIQFCNKIFRDTFTFPSWIESSSLEGQCWPHHLSSDLPVGVRKNGWILVLVSLICSNFA